MDEDKEIKHYRIQVFGRVQGVAFRYYTRLKAEELKLKGTTRNLKDGSVLTYIVGSMDKIDKFLEWCGEGSPASRVDKVTAADVTADKTQEYHDFSILR